ncbi:MAG: UDP-N-acetylmuramate dehydrogenase [Treponema sp.]|nr:UDP-N-acetylmuramate dehydrogenase [Treponema sp.]
MERIARFEALKAQLEQNPDYSGKITLEEPLARRTTMRVGGNAAFFLEPGDENSLLVALSMLEKAQEPYVLLAGGSNVIISDAGICGTVISMRALRDVSVSPAEPQAGAESAAGAGQQTGAAPHAGAGASGGVVLTAQAGASWARVISLCREKLLSGFEGFAGLPGTVGGALFMNASCFGHAACDNLLSVRYWADGRVHEYTLPPLTDSARNEALQADWGYKRSPFQKPVGACQPPVESHMHSGGSQPHPVNAQQHLPVLLSASFACAALPSDAADEACARLCAQYDETLRARVAKGHFSKPSAGSTFKNNALFGVPAGKLIDDSGLKGLKIGGAQVAPWHGNIIINAGGATASDIRALIQQVQDTVKARTGFLLEPEVLFLGSW